MKRTKKTSARRRPADPETQAHTFNVIWKNASDIKPTELRSDPPLGISPYHLWADCRIRDLIAAMQRYAADPDPKTHYPIDYQERTRRFRAVLDWAQEIVNLGTFYPKPKQP